MKKIILFGNGKDNALSSLLLLNLADRFIMTHCFKTGALTKGSGEELLIYTSDSLETVTAKDSVLVFQDNADLPRLKQADRDTVAVIHSENLEAIKKAAELSIVSVTCGMSRKDTVTFSSIGENAGVVSLQRAVKAIDGTVCEPFEIPVRWKGSLKEYTLLCFVMLLVMLSVPFDMPELVIDTGAKK